MHLTHLPPLLLLPLTTAHFLLNSPPTIGFDDDLEATPPCGSFTPDFTKDNLTSFHASGDAIALTSTHPVATWLFRATLDPAGASNWTTLLPPVAQTGLGDYCETGVKVPESWVGQKGVIGVVQDAADGLLYQCAAVTFVAGTAPSLPSGCKNVTGLSAEYTADATLSALPASATGSASATGAAPAPSGSAAKTSGAGREGGRWGVGVALVVIVGAAGVIAGGV